MKPAVKAAVCGVCTALSVALMFLGGITYIFSYVVPVVLGILLIMLKRTFGKGSAFTVYIATSLLSLLLVPEKETVLLFALFFGYYPIIKSSLDKIKPKALSLFVKLIIFNASVLVIELLCVYAFGIPFFEDGVFSAAMLISFAVLMNVVFILYEYVLKIYLALYIKKFEKRVKRFFKR